MEIFIKLQSQWRIISGFGGIVYQGIEYNSLISILSLYAENQKEKIDIFEKIQIIEQGCLSTINKRH